MVMITNDYYTALLDQWDKAIRQKMPQMAKTKKNAVSPRKCTVPQIHKMMVTLYDLKFKLLPQTPIFTRSSPI